MSYGQTEFGFRMWQIIEHMKRRCKVCDLNLILSITMRKKNPANYSVECIRAMTSPQYVLYFNCTSWKGLLEMSMSSLLLKAWPTRFWCSGLWPVKFWIFPRTEVLQLLWDPIPLLNHPDVEKALPYIMLKFFMCPVPLCAWEESDTIFYR